MTAFVEIVDPEAPVVAAPSEVMVDAVVTDSGNPTAVEIPPATAVTAAEAGAETFVEVQVPVSGDVGIPIETSEVIEVQVPVVNTAPLPTVGPPVTVEVAVTGQQGPAGPPSIAVGPAPPNNPPLDALWLDTSASPGGTPTPTQASATNWAGEGPPGDIPGSTAGQTYLDTTTGDIYILQ